MYIGSQDGGLYALDEETGSRLWSYTFEGGITADTVVDNGIAYVAVLDHGLYAFDTSSRTTRWRFETEGRLWNGPVVAGGRVYVGSTDGNLYAVDTGSGGLVWSYETGDRIVGQAAHHDGNVYFTSYDTHLYSVDASNGGLVWRAPLASGSLARPAIGEGVVYIGAFDGRVYAFDLETGVPLWTYWIGDQVWSSPTVHEGTVLVGADDGRLHALDARDGSLQWSFSTGGDVRSSPVISAGTAYFGSDDDSAYAVDVATGALVWEFQTGDDVRASPLVTDDTVYVGSHDATLYAVAAGVPRNAALSMSSTLVPTPVPEFTPLSPEEMTDVLDRISDLPGLGGKTRTAETSTIISTLGDAFHVFETGHFLLTGKPSGWIPRVLTRTQYQDRINEKRDPGLVESQAYCCERTLAGLELVVDGSKPSQSVIGSIAHEAGHARQRTRNPGQSGPRDSNIGALREAEAQAFSAALVRTLGEYTGINATFLPLGIYDLEAWVKDWVSSVLADSADLTEEHQRGRGLLWGAVLIDPDLVELKAELVENRILSGDSMLTLHDHLVSIQRDEADAYVVDALEAFRTNARLVEQTILSRGAGIPNQGFFEHNSRIFLLP